MYPVSGVFSASKFSISNESLPAVQARVKVRMEIPHVYCSTARVTNLRPGAQNLPAKTPIRPTQLLENIYTGMLDFVLLTLFTLALQLCLQMDTSPIDNDRKQCL